MSNNLLEDNSYLNDKKKEKKEIFKSLFLQKIYPKKESTDLNQEINLRQKIISNIKKRIESQILIKNEFQYMPIPSSPQKKNNIPILKKKIETKKKKRENLLNNKIKMGPMVLFDLNKKINSIYFNKGKERLLSSSKNFILSPYKDMINYEYKKIKLNNITKRRDKKYLTHNSFSPIFNSNLFNSETSNNEIINNGNNNFLNNTYIGKKNTYREKMFKRDTSWNTHYSSNSKNKHQDINDINLNKELLFSSFLNKKNNDLQFSNWTTRNKRNISQKNYNIINNSDSKNIINNDYISNYSDKKNITNFHRQSTYTKNNNALCSNNTTNSNNDLINYATNNKITNNSYSSNNKKNIIYNSQESKIFKKTILKSDSLFYKKIKSNMKNILKLKNENNCKKLSNKFKNHFYKKVNSLNNITKSCNIELIRLIDINNKEKEESIKYRKKSKIDEVKKELDIRKDVFDKKSMEESKKIKLKKYKALMNDVKVEMNLSDIEDKKLMTMLRKKINIISDSIALNMIEKYLGIKQNAGFDIDELFNDHIKKKNDIQKFKIQEIRKKAENNYLKMIKLRHTLSGSKLFNKSLSNNEDNKDKV